MNRLRSHRSPRPITSRKLAGEVDFAPAPEVSQRRAWRTFLSYPDQEVEVEKSGDTYEEKAEEAREAPGEGQGQGAAEDDETERAEK